MSFLTISTRRLATVARTAARPQMGVFSVASPFSTSAARPKSVAEAAADTVKGTLKNVDRAVSDKLVDGIDVSKNVASKVKEVGQDITSGKAAGKAEQAGNEAAAKGRELKKDAEYKADDLKEGAKDKTEEYMDSAAKLKGNAKDKTQDLKEGAAKLKEDAKDKVRQAADEVKNRV